MVIVDEVTPRVSPVPAGPVRAPVAASCSRGPPLALSRPVEDPLPAVVAVAAVVAVGAAVVGVAAAVVAVDEEFEDFDLLLLLQPAATSPTATIAMTTGRRV